ncbi:MAG TPA: SOS response-associated peptidase [Solirubrobacteraceae bacterium]|nr:SOS response-associated peptidase [Solirubrobacteraceae bacterium]
MCGRYSLATSDHRSIRARFPIGDSVEIRQRFNVAPTDEVLTVTTDKHGVPRGELLRWGLVPSWADSPSIGAKMINARVETAADKPAFRRAFTRYRCLIVADGFYEWRRTPGAPKQPFRITRDDHEPFAFAGLWSVWHGDGEQTLRTCTILTTAANAAIETLHDRMPVILPPGHEDEWLDLETPSGRLHEILAGLPARHTELIAVGAAVNDVRNDGPECLAPAAPPPAQAQPSLF